MIDLDLVSVDDIVDDDVDDIVDDDVDVYDDGVEKNGEDKNGSGILHTRFLVLDMDLGSVIFNVLNKVDKLYSI